MPVSVTRKLLTHGIKYYVTNTPSAFVDFGGSGASRGSRPRTPRSAALWASGQAAVGGFKRARPWGVGPGGGGGLMLQNSWGSGAKP